MELNNRQKKVVEATDSHILCLASAASGKSRTLTERIRYLIEKRNVKPQDIVAISFTNMAADEIKRRIGSSCAGAYIGTVHGYANQICLANSIDTSQWIRNFDFDEIIKRAIKIPQNKYKRVEHILIDECQDLSPLEYNFLEHIPANNRFYTGDNRQCQPAGTKIMLRNNVIKNIEDVVPGDNIVYYIPHDGYMSGISLPSTSVGKVVLKTASREFVNDELITLVTENNLITRYTPNHIGYIKLHQCEYNHAVYLMCDNNNRFRIGKIPFTCTNKSRGNPWRDKMYAEGCTKIWILDVFKTDKEARLLETKLSYKYRIPQTCWQQDKVSWTQKDLDYIYDGLDTYNSAKNCLKEFHRDIRYPLLDKSMEKNLHIHFARNAVTEIYACNIMPKVMDVLVYDKEDRHHKHYENIAQIDYNYITEPIQVYSLETETGNYIADGILTHNCIYQFKGCTDEYLIAMYYDNTYTKYFLTDNYRNAPNIIDFAEGYIYNANPIGPPSQAVKTVDGTIEHCNFMDALDELEWSGNWGSWFILTRTNNELVQAQDYCNERGIPNVTFKKGDLDILQLDAIIASNKVKILTIHSAKGLENKNVIVTGARTYNEEERKICYVAATRAENNLYWCPAIAKKHIRGQGIKPRAEAGRIFDKSSETIIF